MPVESKDICFQPPRGARLSLRSNSRIAAVFDSPREQSSDFIENPRFSKENRDSLLAYPINLKTLLAGVFKFISGLVNDVRTCFEQYTSRYFIFSLTT